MKYILILLTVGLTAGSWGCKKSAATRSDDTSGMTIDMPSSLKVYAGKNRVLLSWRISTDERISQCRVYWNAEQDSLDVPVAGKDSMGVILDDLEEGTYNFMVAAFDSEKNASAKVQIKGTVYGEQYANSLTNRPIENINYDSNQRTANIQWGNTPAGAVAMEIYYTDISGESRIQHISSTYSEVTLRNYRLPEDSVIIYRTVFLPESSAIDTFFTAKDSVVMKPSPEEGGGLVSVAATLQADGPGDTYELINGVLGGNAEEVPDCSDPDFGPHIKEEFDNELNKFVFAFFIHVTPDNDRCTNFDRQRNEIKTYSPSPDSLKAFKGDEMLFKWKFKLADEFQPSYSFTHIHQIKAGDGPHAGAPLITITPRYGDPDQLEIIHTSDSQSSTGGKVEKVDLTPFKGNWIEATERITFGSHGSYKLELKKESNGRVLLSYFNDDIDFWRTGTTFMRPKWGIYRSLHHSEQLRDEKVLFADFIIGKK